MKKRVLLLVTLGIILGVATAFAGGGQEAGAGQGRITLGVTLPQLDADGFRVNLEAVQDVAGENDAEVLSFSANNAVETQLQQIEDLITRGVDAIIFIPVDAEAMSTGVMRANDAGIPIVAMDRSTTSGELTALVESDNVAHGRVGAELIAEAAQKAGLDIADLKVLELLGAQTTSAGLERHQGFADKAAELGMDVVASLPTEWQADRAYASTLDAFQANPDINAIFMASDIAMYTGVESALDQMGRLIPIGQEGHIIVTGVDGGPTGMDAVRAGYIDGIAAQQLITMGRLAAERALDAINGRSIDEPVLRLEPGPVVPENVDSPEHWANQL